MASTKINSVKNVLDVPDIPLENILFEESDELNELMKPSTDRPSSYIDVKPHPGFCIKTRDENGKKVFLNICHCSELPKPYDMTEEELYVLVQSDEPSSYRIPMSLGEAQMEKDKGGNPCTAYSIVINSEHFAKVEKSEVFRTFLIAVCVEGIEDKYKINLNKDSCVILKNKKHHGTIPQHRIVMRPKPLITEVPKSTVSSSQKVSQNKQDAIPRKRQKESLIMPDFTIFSRPSGNGTKELVMKVLLPEVTHSSDIDVDIGEDRVVLHALNKYHLDIFLAYYIFQDKVKVMFNIGKQTLILVMPVISSS